jgi:hypothetical protein
MEQGAPAEGSHWRKKRRLRDGWSREGARFLRPFRPQRQRRSFPSRRPRGLRPGLVLSARWAKAGFADVESYPVTKEIRQRGTFYINLLSGSLVRSRLFSRGLPRRADLSILAPNHLRILCQRFVFAPRGF